MKLGIMQPYFFPFLGHFDLIRATDRWVVFDTPQYIRHGWLSRNRILHPSGGWQWIVVPLCKHSHTTAIKDVAINEDLPWRQTIMGQLTHYRRGARHYDTTVQFVKDCLTDPETSLARLNLRILARVCAELGIPFHYEFLSELNIDLGTIEEPGDWALRISAALGASEYVNPPGGEALFDRTAFERAGITLTIRQPPCLEYRCRGYSFEPDLSIIDLLMWNRPEEIAEFLSRKSPGNL